MPWRKVSAELSDLLAEAVVGFSCERRVMFGCPAYFVKGNMFTGVHQDSIILRLSPADREAMLSTWDETSLFEPVEGRPMREYVVLPEDVYNNPQLLQEWLQRSWQYASALPLKEPKGKPKRK